MGSKLSELVLEMCLAYTDTSAYRRRHVSRISLAEGKRRCQVLMRRGAVLLKHKKSSPNNLRMSDSGFWARKLSRQYALFTLTPNLSNLIVTNPVLGKNLEHPPLTRQCSDMGQVRWKVYKQHINFSHIAIYAGNGWPHNALRHYRLMPISCHFRDCKALLVTSLTHVSGAIASIQTFTFT